MPSFHRNSPLRAALALALALVPGQSLIAGDLLEVYQRALHNDPALRSAQYQPKIAKQNQRRALGATLPQVGSFYQYSYTDIHQSAKPGFAGGSITPATDIHFYSENSGVSVDQVLFDIRAFIAFRELNYGYDIAEGHLNATRLQSVLNAVNAYFRQLLASADVRLANAELEALSVQLKAAKLRLELGADSRISVQQIQARHDQADARAIIARNDLLNSQNQLWAITLKRYDHLAFAKSKPPRHDYQPKDVAHWVRLALGQNPDVASALARTEQSRMSRRRVNGNYMPRATIRYLYGQQSVSGSDRLEATFSEGVNQSVSLRVDFPLFSGGGNIAQSRIASYEYQANRENEQLMRRRIENEVVQLWNSHNALRAALDAREAALLSATSSLELVRKGKELGNNSTSDLLNSVSEQYQAERDFVAAIYDYLFNQARFEATVGILSTETIMRLNSHLQE